MVNNKIRKAPFIIIKNVEEKERNWEEGDS
jgi:hypothetical protein